MKKSKGFTLVEIMVAIIILATILFVSLGFFPQCVRLAGIPERRSMAVNLAREAMEDRCWVVSFDTNQVNLPLPTDNAGAELLNRNGRRRLELNEASTPNNFYRVANVTVTWNE